MHPKAFCFELLKIKLSVNIKLKFDNYKETTLFEFNYKDKDDLIKKVIESSNKDDWFWIDGSEPIFIYKKDSRIKLIVRDSDSKVYKKDDIVNRFNINWNKIDALYRDSGKFYIEKIELSVENICAGDFPCINIDGKLHVPLTDLADSPNKPEWAKKLLDIINPRGDFGVYHKN